MAEQEVLLDIKTVAERRIISINNKRYEIRSINEYGVIDQFRFSSQGKRIQELLAKITDTGIDEALVNEFDGLVNAIIGKIVVGIEPAINESLTLDNRMAIINLFTQAPTGKTAAADQVPNQK